MRSGVRGDGALPFTAVGMVAALLGVACSTSPGPVAGLELVISAEGLTAPKDFDDIRLQVSQQIDAGGWRLLWDRDYLVPSAEATLPTTFTLFAGQSPDEVLIAVTAYQALNGQAAGQPIVQRVAQVQVPTDRMAALYLVLAKACEGQVITGVSGEPTPKCPSGESCQPATGQCGSNIIGSSMLPSYEPGDASALDSGSGLSDVGVDRAKGDASPTRDGTSTSGDDEFGSGDDRSVPSESAAVDPTPPGLDATVPETGLDSSTAMDSRPSTDECDIGGTTYSSGAPNPTNSCQSCQLDVSRSAFSDLTDGTSCGTGGICHTGACVSGCEIGGVYYATDGTDPSNPCQSCQPGTSTKGWTAVANGTSCGTGTCCSSQCVDEETDDDNCGSCGTTCIITCAAGLCLL
jgi:hypothetical protein